VGGKKEQLKKVSEDRGENEYPIRRKKSGKEGFKKTVISFFEARGEQRGSPRLSKGEPCFHHPGSKFP